MYITVCVIVCIWKKLKVHPNKKNSTVKKNYMSHGINAPTFLRTICNIYIYYNINYIIS